jgi:hypothetical protein
MHRHVDSGPLQHMRTTNIKYKPASRSHWGALSRVRPSAGGPGVRTSSRFRSQIFVSWYLEPAHRESASSFRCRRACASHATVEMPLVMGSARVGRARGRLLWPRSLMLKGGPPARAGARLAASITASASANALPVHYSHRLHPSSRFAINLISASRVRTPVASALLAAAVGKLTRHATNPA